MDQELKDVENIMSISAVVFFATWIPLQLQKIMPFSLEALAVFYLLFGILAYYKTKNGRNKI